MYKPQKEEFDPGGQKKALKPCSDNAIHTFYLKKIVICNVFATLFSNNFPSKQGILTIKSIQKLGKSEFYGKYCSNHLS